MPNFIHYWSFEVTDHGKVALLSCPNFCVIESFESSGLVVDTCQTEMRWVTLLNRNELLYQISFSVFEPLNLFFKRINNHEDGGQPHILLWHIQYTKELAVIMNVKVNFVFNVDLLSPLLGIVETSLLVQIYLYKWIFQDTCISNWCMEFFECEECSIEYWQSYKTLLWIWIMSWVSLWQIDGQKFVVSIKTHPKRRWDCNALF